MRDHGKRIIKIAIHCIKREIRRICVDANLHDLYKADFPYAVKCSRKKKELLEAIQYFEELEQNNREES